MAAQRSSAVAGVPLQSSNFGSVEQIFGEE
jgi:hypothetical protein